jgi:hypothetical protein
VAPRAGGQDWLVWSAMRDGSCHYVSAQWMEHTGVPTDEAGPGAA